MTLVTKLKYCYCYTIDGLESSRRLHGHQLKQTFCNWKTEDSKKCGVFLYICLVPKFCIEKITINSNKKVLSVFSLKCCHRNNFVFTSLSSNSALKKKNPQFSDVKQRWPENNQPNKWFRQFCFNLV